MNVVLEISVPDVIDFLADHKQDAAYQKALEMAKQEETKSQKDFITLFVDAYHQVAPGHKLAEIFATQELKGKVSTQSTDGEVVRHFVKQLLQLSTTPTMLLQTVSTSMALYSQISRN